MSTKRKENEEVVAARADVDEASMDLDSLQGSPEGGNVQLVATQADDDTIIAVANQPGATSNIPLEKFTGHRAVLAVPAQEGAPLIFDVLYEGKIFLIAFALAHMTDDGLRLSDLNAQLWRPLKIIAGETIFQPMFGNNAAEVEACLASMKNYDSGTHFLMMSNDIAAIQQVVRKLGVFSQGSAKLH